MNTTNQIFSWKRYTAALRKELVEKRHIMLACIIAMFLFFLAGISMGTKYQEIARATSVFYIISSFITLSAVVPSLAFSQLANKSRRVELFSLPTSTTEKYAVRLTIYVIGFLVAFAACVQLADWVRYAFFNKNVAPDNLIESIKIVFSGVTNLGHMRTVPAVSNYMHIAPFFLLGSILWPRLSFLKSLGACFLISVIETFIIYIILGFISHGKMAWIDVTDDSRFMEMDIIISFILMVGSIVLGWYLLKRKDIVSRKWWK